MGSLLSSCWQARKKTMLIHSFGIEALSGLDQTLSVGFGRGGGGNTLSLHPFTVNTKTTLLLQSCSVCTSQHKLRGTTRNGILDDTSCFTEIYIKTAKKKKKENPKMFHCYS